MHALRPTIQATPVSQRAPRREPSDKPLRVDRELSATRQKENWNDKKKHGATVLGRHLDPLAPRARRKCQACKGACF